VRCPYWQDAAARLYVGDAREVMAEMPDRSVSCVVTSPPYFGLRDYGLPGQYGLEATAEEYVDNLRRVFAEARRVLADDGTLWLNIGDSYSGGARRSYDTDGRKSRGRALAGQRPVSGLPGKNLLGIPWRLATALRQDDWIVRNQIIWAKPNGMPESVRDRLSCRHETIFLLVKQPRYWFDLDAIRETLQWSQPHPAGGRWQGPGHGGTRRRLVQPKGGGKYSTSAEPLRGRCHGNQMLPTGRRHAAAHGRGKNPGDVWVMPTRPFRQAHFAVFPIDLPLRCIAAGCRPGGTVLDPFNGAGTTGLAARQLGRQFIGVDISAAFCDLAIARMRAVARGEAR
jgi:DNA modification methylase